MEKWEDLNRIEQDKFLNKASYLTSKGYVAGEIEDVAIKLYYTSLRKGRDSEKD